MSNLEVSFIPFFGGFPNSAQGRVEVAELQFGKPVA